MDLFEELLNGNPHLNLSEEEREKMLNKLKDKFIAETANPSLIDKEQKKVFDNICEFFVTDRISKLDKTMYNSMLWLAIKQYELIEEYDKCEVLKDMFLEIPEGYQPPKCTLNLNPLLKHNNLETIPEEEMVLMTDEECVVRFLEIASKKVGREFVRPSDEEIKILVKYFYYRLGISQDDKF